MTADLDLGRCAIVTTEPIVEQNLRVAGQLGHG